MYLTDADVRVVRVSSYCLKAILCTNSGGGALHVISDEIKEELRPYRPASKSAKVLHYLCLFFPNVLFHIY